MNPENTFSTGACRLSVFSGLRGNISSRRLAIFFLLLFWLGMVNVSFSAGSIFSWVDNNGVRHYSNKPPAGMDESRLDTTDEIPFDPEVDEQRNFQEQQWLEQKEKADMEERLTEAEKKAEAARQRAEESARKAEQLQEELDQVREEQQEYSRRVYVPYQPYRPRPPIYDPDRPGGKPGRPGGKPERPHRPSQLPNGKQSGGKIKVHID